MGSAEDQNFAARWTFSTLDKGGGNSIVGISSLLLGVVLEEPATSSWKVRVVVNALAEG